MRPYNDVRLSRHTLLREFNARIDDIEYTWHRDEDDRIIEVFNGAGWQLQLDNQLPVLLESGCEYYIPAGVWHRLHKGQDNLTILISEGKKKKKVDGFRSVKYGADNNPKVTKMDFLPTKTLKNIAKEKEVDEEIDQLEERKKRKSKAKLTPGYKANRSQKSQDKLKKLIDRFNKAKKTPGKKDDLAAIKARDRFEKTQYKSSRKSQYNEADDVETLINELAEEMDIFEKKKRKKKKKKKGGSRKISSKVDKQLKKKAKDRNAPVGALKAIYRKGMGAFYSSGSRSGQNPHSWAMARVNSVLSGGKARSVDASQWKQIQKHRKKNESYLKNYKILNEAWNWEEEKKLNKLIDVSINAAISGQGLEGYHTSLSLADSMDLKSKFLIKLNIYLDEKLKELEYWANIKKDKIYSEDEEMYANQQYQNALKYFPLITQNIKDEIRYDIKKY